MNTNTKITKAGSIITEAGVEPTAREIIAARAIRAARAKNAAARAARARR
jgi:hypothetical protein